MKDVPFVINGRFFVDPTLSYFRDGETHEETRLEPRLMAVLYFLAANENQLVTREKLIKEIWNDYGGADEGLSQAVSFLRKLFGDREKKVIVTIPKKGYILHASITEKTEEGIEYLNKKTAVTQNRKKNIYRIAGLLFVLLTALILIYINTPQTQPNPDILQDMNKVKHPDKQVDSTLLPTDSIGADVIRASLIIQKID